MTWFESIVFLVFLLFSPILSSAKPLSSSLAPRAAPAKYFAQGDSYGSGIASGEYVDSTPGSADWKCSRFTSAYPRQLNGILGGAADFQHQACSGADSAIVQASQAIDPDADLATLTVGGNDADFGDIVDKCVYGFSPNGLSDANCQSALSATESNIDNKVWNAVWNAVWNILNINKKPTFQLFLTNYPKFWNATTTQCDDISFNYWSGPSASYKMTQARRTAMNDLTDKLNAQLASVVGNFNGNNENRVHLVDIDSEFTGHRFCEDGINEPQQPGQDVSNTWIFQYNTPIGSLNPNSSGNGGPNADGADWFASIQAAQQANPSWTVNSLYASQPVNTGDDFGSSGGLPLFLSKLFHPTTPGHTAIANAINAAIGAAPVSVQTTSPAAPPPATTAPPPASSSPVQCVWGNCQECDRVGCRPVCQCLCNGVVSAGKCGAGGLVPK